MRLLSQGRLIEHPPFDGEQIADDHTFCLTSLSHDIAQVIWTQLLIDET